MKRKTLWHRIVPFIYARKYRNSVIYVHFTKKVIQKSPRLCFEKRVHPFFTIQNVTPACSGHPNLSAPSSSCRRWDSPGCTAVRRDSVTAVNTGCLDKCVFVYVPSAEHVFVKRTLATLTLSP